MYNQGGKNAARLAARSKTWASSRRRTAWRASSTTTAVNVTLSGTANTTSATRPPTSPTRTATPPGSGKRIWIASSNTYSFTRVSTAARPMWSCSNSTTVTLRPSSWQSVRCCATTAGRRLRPRSPSAMCDAQTITGDARQSNLISGSSHWRGWPLRI